MKKIATQVVALWVMAVLLMPTASFAEISQTFVEQDSIELQGMSRDREGSHSENRDSHKKHRGHGNHDRHDGDDEDDNYGDEEDGTPSVWTTYCTGGEDINENNWQWWEYDNQDPINYRFVRDGDGSCVPPVWTTYCTGGEDINGNNWQWWEYNNADPIDYRFVRNGDGECVPPPVEEVDVCNNIEGTQTVIPQGMTLSEGGACVPVVVDEDLCPNIEGTQSEVPSGMYVTEGGSCVVSDSEEDKTLSCDLTITPSSAKNGSSVTMSWETANAESASIDGGVGAVELSGSTNLVVTANKTYTLTASRGEDSVTCSASVSLSSKRHHSGGGGYVGRPAGKKVTGGQVLGASTDVPNTCGLYLKTYMRENLKNDTEEVKKLQTFLNKELKLNLRVDGVFESLTDAAVRIFQKKYRDDVLTPWGMKEASGYVYKTTQRKINLIECASLHLPMPDLSN